MKVVRELYDRDFVLPDEMSDAEPIYTLKVIIMNDSANVAVISIANPPINTFPTGLLDGESYSDETVCKIAEVKTGCSCKIIGRMGTIFENSAALDTVRYTSVVLVKAVKMPTKSEEEKLGSKTLWCSIDNAYNVIKGLSGKKDLSERYARQRDILALDVLVKYLNAHPDIYRYDF